MTYPTALNINQLFSYNPCGEVLLGSFYICINLPICDCPECISKRRIVRKEVLGDLLS